MAFNLFKTKKSIRPAQDKPTTKRKTSVAKVKVIETPVLPVQADEVAPETVKVSHSSITPVSAILHPYVSEKATRLEGMNQYMFKVTRFANKPEVKKAIQNRYKVTVVAVNMINMPSKKRTVGRHVGTKSGFRKAIVTLTEGDTINSTKA